MRKFCLSTLAVLLTATFTFATDFAVPKVNLVVTDGNNVVEAGKPVPLGELVDISVSKPDGTTKYLIATTYDWKLLENGKERKFKSPSGDPSNIWYAAGIKAKKQQVFCVVTYLYVVRANPTDEKSAIVEVASRTQFLYADISIGDATPDPVTPPAPDPAPNLADGKFKLAKSTYDLAMKKVAAGADRAKAAKALADSFRGIASSVKAGAIKDPKDILSKTAAKNQSSLADAKIGKDVWTPFFTDFLDVIYGMYEVGAISTADDFADAWNEIATGLEAIK